MNNDRTYKAPWAREVKIGTYITNAFLIGISLLLGGLGFCQIRGGQPLGWMLIAESLPCLLILILVRLWAPKGYRIGDEAVYVQKRVRDEELPFQKMSSIEIRDSREIFASTMRVGSGGYYGAYGYFYGGVLSSFRALVTNDGPLVVLRMKRGEPVVISPEDPYGFAQELSNRTGLLVEDKEAPVEDRIVSTPPLTTAQKVLECLSAALLLFTFAAVIYFWDKIPQTIPTHFGFEGKPDAYGPKSTLWLLPAIGLVIYAVMTAVSRYISKASSEHPKAVRMLGLTRWIVGSIKCSVMAMTAYIVWKSGLTATGKADGLGSGFTIVVLLIAVGIQPILIMAVALAAAKSEDS